MSLSLHPVGGFWFVAIIATVLLVLLARVGPRHVEVPFGRLLTLKMLRLVAILLLLFAMLRPTLQFTRSTPEEATLLVLADRSRSMQVEDSLDNRSRYGAMRLVLAEASGDLEELQKNWNVRAYTFAESLEPVDVKLGSLALADSPTGEQSPLGAALQELLEREGDQRLKGVIVLSDGAQRAVPPLDAAPQLVARQYAAEGVPLYTFYFGQPGGSDRSDLAINDLLVSGTVFANAPMRVNGQLQALGYANRRVKVQLLWEEVDDKGKSEMKVVDTSEQEIVAAETSAPVSLGYTPATPGEYKVTLRAESPEGELITTNNEASTFVTVREGGIKVLYLYGASRIGGSAGVEQAFVPRTIDESPDILVSRKLFDYTRPREDLRRELQPGNYDVVILSDVDKEAMSPESWQALAEMVRRGTGLMMGGGYHSFGPGGFLNNPITDVLPVDIGPAERQNFRDKLREDVHVPGPVKMQPAGNVGRTHPIMQITASGQPGEGWEDLPPLDGANRLSRRLLKQNAQVLAESADAARHPLLVAGQAGNGRTLAFAGDTTFRWQLENHGDEFRRFWRQVILWLARKDDDTSGRVWLDLATRRVSRGGRLDVEVGATPGEEDDPNATIDFDVVVTLPDGTQQPLVTVATDAGRRAGTFATTDQPGDYTVEVTAKIDGKELGSARARFLVPDQDLELDRPGAEPTLLAGLAKLTEAAGGEALAPEELPALIRKLAAERPELKTEVIERHTYWDKWPFMLMFIAVVGVEWFLRKRWGLV
ncbi:glutamine amidotransferase [Aeoliella sp.]|uniref:glutamine amidotransferase n=1 Tax=Aeoliella sp. TaxID=2795800 RepID=UPI003CCBEB53